MNSTHNWDTAPEWAKMLLRGKYSGDLYWADRYEEGGKVLLVGSDRENPSQLIPNDLAELSLIDIRDEVVGGIEGLLEALKREVVHRAALRVQVQQCSDNISSLVRKLADRGVVPAATFWREYDK